MVSEKVSTIATLADSHAYKLLLQELRVTFSDVEARLEAAGSDNEVLQAGRYWQVSRRMLRWLSETPEAYRQQVKEALKLDGGVPTGESYG